MTRKSYTPPLDPDTLSHSLRTLPTSEAYPLISQSTPPRARTKVVGAKDDGGKLRWSLLPLDALREIVRVLMKGADKYTPGGWEHVDSARDRYYDAALRHLTAWFEGERLDPEFGTHHLANACCCVLFLLALSLRGKIE
jgi:fermentation-respiration switch protein FrsA (DUF1100 family)